MEKLVKLLKAVIRWLKHCRESEINHGPPSDDFMARQMSQVRVTQEDGTVTTGYPPKPIQEEKTMQISISSGHGLRVRGAAGILDEVKEARRVTDRVAEILRANGHAVNVFHDDSSTTVAQNINWLVAQHNRSDRDLDVSVHFNAFQPTDGPMGTEVLHRTGDGVAAGAAARVTGAMARAGGFRARAVQPRDNLGFLLNCQQTPILLEVCFVDSRADADLYNQNFEAICQGIAGALVG